MSEQLDDRHDDSRSLAFKLDYLPTDKIVYVIYTVENNRDIHCIDKSFYIF